MPYQVSYILNPEEIRRFARAQYDALHGGWKLVLRTSLGLVLLPTTLLSLWRLLAMEGHAEARQTLLPLLLVELLVAFLLLFHRPLALRSQRRSLAREATQEPVSYTLGEEGVSGNRFGTPLPLAWAHFQALRIRQDGIFLLVGKNSGHWLPRHAFASEEAWGKASSIAHARWRQAHRP